MVFYPKKNGTPLESLCSGTLRSDVWLDQPLTWSPRGKDGSRGRQWWCRRKEVIDPEMAQEAQLLLGARYHSDDVSAPCSGLEVQEKAS